MIATIHLNLRNSIAHSPPENVKTIMTQKVKEMIGNDAWLNLFVGGFEVEVE